MFQFHTLSRMKKRNNEMLFRLLIDKLYIGGCITRTDIPVCEYALHLLTYNISNTFFLLAIGSVLGYFSEVIVFLSIFYFNQSFGGGYHADSHKSCIFLMILGEIIYIGTFQYTLSPTWYYFLAIFCFCYLFMHPLTLHKNKSYLRAKSREIIKRNRILVMMQLFVFNIAMHFSTLHYIHAITLSLLFSTLSRIASALSVNSHVFIPLLHKSR